MGLIFKSEINAGLRVNDLVCLKVRDMKDKVVFDIREVKTNNRHEIQRFIVDKHLADYLFASQKNSKAISTTQVYWVLNNAADSQGREVIGTHTTRKIFGYHQINTKILQQLFKAIGVFYQVSSKLLIPLVIANSNFDFVLL